MNVRKQQRIAASLRDQMLDVSLGITLPAVWVERYDEAVEQGVTVFPETVVYFRNQLAGDRPQPLEPQPVHIWRCNKEEDHEPHITHTDDRGNLYQCLGEDVQLVDE